VFCKRLTLGNSQIFYDECRVYSCLYFLTFDSKTLHCSIYYSIIIITIIIIIINKVLIKVTLNKVIAGAL